MDCPESLSLNVAGEVGQLKNIERPMKRFLPDENDGVWPGYARAARRKGCKTQIASDPTDLELL